MNEFHLKKVTFKEFLSFRRNIDPLKDLEEVSDKVRKILKEVKVNGEKALLKFSKKFDNLSAKNLNELIYSRDKLEDSYNVLPKEIKDDLIFLKSRIQSFHQSISTADWEKTDEVFSKYGQISRPIRRIGLYAPGGSAIYPSSVLMTSVLAKIAGVKEILLCFPPSNEKNTKLMLATAFLGEVDQVISIGGAQAIGAMAFGTDNFEKVDKIFGPGNQYVAEAKRQVFGIVGIDAMTGPSEVMIIADETADVEMIALDLIAQAEHGPNSSCILVLVNNLMAEKVEDKVSEYLQNLNFNKDSNAYKSLKNLGLIVNVSDFEEAKEVCNQFNPEHLQLILKNESQVNLKEIYAGAIFLGQKNTAVLGDYCAGPSHVIPTNGATKFSSQLSIQDFFINSSFTHITNSRDENFKKILETSRDIAIEEGLAAHANAVDLRLKRLFN